MEIYLVGGAIRDELLGLPIKERDWVVVGASPEELLAKGFIPVGKEFPVFLHPETYEEYALARTERKTGKGYKGFTFHTSTDVTLEEDLRRRDLTINAMARSEENKLIDPYHGQKDLKEKILRHVSPAFSEDPVRILRVARFAAKLPEFTVFPETKKLMEKMVDNGEVNALVSERVWQEFERALKEKSPERFFEVLNDCHALPILFPEINPHGDGMKALKKACELSVSPTVRFAALLHDVSEHSVKALCHRLKTPREYLDLARLVSQWVNTYKNIETSTSANILHLLKSVDALRRPERFEKFLLACQAGVYTKEKDLDLTRPALLLKILVAVTSVDITPLQAQQLKGQEFAAALHDLQIKAIEKVLSLSP